jgi:hypothetical protein
MKSKASFSRLLSGQDPESIPVKRNGVLYLPTQVNRIGFVQQGPAIGNLSVRFELHV